MADWLSLTFLVQKEEVETFSDWLFQEKEALSVTVEDADAGTPAEVAQFDEPTEDKSLWTNNLVTVLFDPSLNVQALSQAIAEHFGAVELRETHLIDNEDWVSKTQSQFDPIRISNRLWIVPTWHVAPNPTAINIQLDPGMAFGTGSHPTTHLCLEWLDENLSPQQSVLDYGCGSGILAIAAGKLGAGRLIGTDIDPQAVEAARRNASNNQVIATFESADKKDLLVSQPFDIVIANILTNPLKVLAPLLTKYVAAGGSIVLSGILVDQASSVIEAYRPFISLIIDKELDGWVRLVGSR